nr:MAG TPA: hypothetical protein [Caudoviricetes sp.]
MAMRFLTDINLLQSELQNAVIQVLATNPANGKQGQIYYNSADNLLYRYDGTQWGPVGVVYNQSSAPGAVVTGLGADGAVTTTNVTGLTLTGYTPVESGYVTAGMTMQQAFAALDEAVKNAVAGGGEVNQNAWSKILVKAQSTAVTAVAGATADTTLSSDAKVDTFTIASGNKWVDINGSGKTVTLGHSLSGVTAGSAGAAASVPVLSVDAAGHVTSLSSATITPVAIGAATSAAVESAQSAADEAAAAAEAAEALADAKVSSVTAGQGIAVTDAVKTPTVAVKLDPAAGNIASLSDAGLKVTAPTVNVPVYSLTKDATSTDYAAVYHLTKDGTNVGEAINIPKDLFVESGEIVENPAGQTPGKYLKLVLQNQTDPVYINVADLVDAYTPGNGITISGTNEVSAKVVGGNGLSVGTDGIKMDVASADAAGAMSSADFAKLAGIDPGATANTITLNGTATKTPSFYAPTTAGTNGQYLKSNGSGAPTWATLPTILKKYTAQNGVLTAAGGAWTWSIAQATHGVTAPLTVQLFDASGNMVMADVAVATNGNVTIVINDTASAGTLAANTYRVVIIG